MINCVSKECQYMYFNDNVEVIRKRYDNKNFAYLKSVESVWFKKAQPKEGCQCVVNAVMEPQRMKMVCQGELASFKEKIKKFVLDIKIFLNSPTDSAYSTFMHVKDSYWKELVRIVLGKDQKNEIKQRARFALLSLEQVDPGLNSYNYLISRLMDSKDEKVQLQAFRCLDRWVESPLRCLQLFFPIKPQTTSKNTPDFSSFLHKEKISRDSSLISFWKSRKIVMGHSSDKQIMCYYNNLQEIAKLEGLAEPLLRGPEWVQDPIIILENEKYLIPAQMTLGNLTIHPFLRTVPPFVTLINKLLNCEEPLMGQVSQYANSLRKYSNIQEAAFYFEGGNLIPAINREGEKFYLCGASNVLFSMLNSNYLFSKKEKKKALLDELQILESSTLFSEKQLEFIQNSLERGGLLTNFNEDEKRKIAKLTMSTISLLKKEIADTLHSKIIIVGNVFEAQPEFHLDMFLMTAPGGIIFIQDHSLSCEVVKKIQEHYKDTLNLDEMERLEIYLKNGKQKHDQFGKMLQEISESLQRNGFKTIPLPGIYYCNKNKININFLNSILGVGENENFCITNGSSHSVDRYLRDSFTQFLNHYGIQHVYFTGRNTVAEIGGKTFPPSQFLGADLSLKVFGGIHCRTQIAPSSFEGFKFGGLKNESFEYQESTNEENVLENSMNLFFVEMLKNF